MKTEIYIKRISNDQLVTQDGKPTVEVYQLVDSDSDNLMSIPAKDLEKELVGWEYDSTEYKDDILILVFVDKSDPEDYL